MDAVTLTFPGHFFQTALSIRSIKRWYQPSIHYVVVDDLSQGPWTNYTNDIKKFLLENCKESNFVFVKTSDIPKMDLCLSGWWRQQLIKLTIDDLLPGDEWLLIDGDVIFDTRCEFQHIVPIDSSPVDSSGTIEILTRNYIKHLLGTEQTSVKYRGHSYLTNTVPYRWLDRPFLQKLRSHVEKRFSENFVDLHIKWFHDQTIVGMHQDLTKLNMSEWELIEVFRKEVLHEDLPCYPIGNGYSLTTDISRLSPPLGMFRHGYVRDTEIEQKWFQEQGLIFDQDIWIQSKNWLKQKEPWRA